MRNALLTVSVFPY